MPISEPKLKTKGIVFDIQKFSVHDGPGVRTIVFLKGCPLSCKWCCNPESQIEMPQVMFMEQNCTGCKRCSEVCKNFAINFNLPNRVDQSKCVHCGKCVEVCFSEALNMAGNVKSVKEILTELSKDDIIYRRSGGGITLSGGEALAQPDFTKELLKGCKAKGFHTAIETSGFTSRTVLERVLPWLDLIMLDIKHMDSNKHKEYVGQNNETILENAKIIAQSGKPLIIRIPIITGFNDDENNIRATAKFVVSLKKVKEIHLLPYHRLGQNKYDYLGYKYKMPELKPPLEEDMTYLKKVVEAEGLVCKIGGIE
ncbi:glycyl-radical enzyme activating protein [Clostridium algoriphilum]|uniref:glycyl-radical enzyme activating protein n=1 Tax=Clostridium algoriphilum TaxID=198347 RepID=UPI001CF18936|nr:glycyl-radical enzyme activating protein [Clostridium algoriphilum]MCB2295630.1 glycyl-radical enzyme activating protein [Clostridium algoriphilum]